MNKKCFLIFIFPFAIFAHFHLSICAIFRDEAPYFREWIEFHKLQGVEHFYLYNNNSEDDYLKTLQPYVNTGEVTLLEWPFKYNPGDADTWRSIQRNAYMNCISTYGLTTDWLAVIDLDEFLFSPSGKTLPQILDNYQEYGGVCANWRMFGTSNIESIPSDFLMIELLTQCSCINYHLNKRIKSIVRPECVLSCRSAHSFFYKEGFYAVDTAKNLTENRRDSDQTYYDQLQINHYWTRSKSNLNHKTESRLNQGLGTLENLLKRVTACNSDSDYSILQFVPALKRQMRSVETGLSKPP